MIKIRKMRREDCPAVHRLQCQCFSVPWSYESIEGMIANHSYHNYVAFYEDRLIGYIGMLAAADEADITNVAVDENLRRRGIGRKLLHYLTKKAGQKNINRIFLEVRRYNEAAVGLYEQAGFCQIDIRKDYYTSPREDALIMMWAAENPEN